MIFSLNKLTPLISLILLLVSAQACTTYQTSFNTMEDIKDSSDVSIKTGKTCSNNLFGGFNLPWIGDTAIRLTGDQSVVTAIKNAKITHVYSVDFSTRHYVLFSKRCTIVFGY